MTAAGLEHPIVRRHRTDANAAETLCGLVVDEHTPIAARASEATCEACFDAEARQAGLR